MYENHFCSICGGFARNLFIFVKYNTNGRMREAAEVPVMFANADTCIWPFENWLFFYKYIGNLKRYLWKEKVVPNVYFYNIFKNYRNH